MTASPFPGLFLLKLLLFQTYSRSVRFPIFDYKVLKGTVANQERSPTSLILSYHPTDSGACPSHQLFNAKNYILTRFIQVSYCHQFCKIMQLHL